MTRVKVAELRLYPMPFRFRSGGFTTSYGTRTQLDGLLLELVANDGSNGYGEILRLSGASQLPTDPDFITRASSALSAVIGTNALSPLALNRALGNVPRDLTNVICGLETAAYDLLGKTYQCPVYKLLGGSLGTNVPYYYCIGQGTPVAMAAAARRSVRQGFKCLQIKVGGSQADDEARIGAILDELGKDDRLLADANGGWTVEEACAVMSRFSDPRIMWEEPCFAFEDNRQVAEKTGKPVVLDQCMSDLTNYARVCVEGFAAGTGLKPSILGGIIAARTARDLCAAHGIAMKIDDCWGVEASNAASLHLALGMPPHLLITSIDMTSYFEDQLQAQAPDPDKTSFTSSRAPGLGVDPDMTKMAPPAATIN